MSAVKAIPGNFIVITKIESYDFKYNPVTIIGTIEGVDNTIRVHVGNGFYENATLYTQKTATTAARQFIRDNSRKMATAAIQPVQDLNKVYDIPTIAKGRFCN